MLAARATKSVNQGNHGPLLRPVTGYVTSSFGWRRHPIYGYWGLHDGTDFHAPCGTPLRARRQRPGDLGVLPVRVGQPADPRPRPGARPRRRGDLQPHQRLPRPHRQVVRRGDTLAYAGTTGWSTACHLHFTVMVDGKPRNPLNWF